MQGILIALTGMVLTGCNSSTPTSISGRFTVQMEVTAPGPAASWTGFYRGHDGSVSLRETTPFSREFPDQRFENCGQGVGTCLQLSAFARPIPPSRGPLTVCLTLVGKGVHQCGMSPTPEGDALVLVFGDD